MIKYILKRLGFLLLTFFVLLTINFICIKLVDRPVPLGKGQKAAEEALRQTMGYGKPVLVQYGVFLKNILLKFNWGYSLEIQYLTPVTEIILDRLTPTLIINVYSLLFSLPIGVSLGVYAALKKNKWQDHFISSIVIFFISVPAFVYAFILQYTLGYKLGLFPIQMRPLSETGYSWFSLKMLNSMIMPILALSFGEIAGYVRYIRAELSEVLTGEFMLLARTKGLSRTQATIRHGFKNAMVPIMPMIIGSFISILAGSLIIENIFGVPGIGGLSLRSINELDYNVFIGVGAFYTFIGLFAALITDISYGFIDPRIRMGARK